MKNLDRSFVHLCARISLLAFVLVLAPSVFSQDKNWRPVTPEEKALKSGKVDPDADAEVLFWEIKVDDTNPESLVMKHYKRVKVFSERGREKFSKVNIPFEKGTKIKDILARVIKADGTTTDLAKTDIFEREVAKTDKIKVKAKSFAVPGIEPGAIVEVQYTEVYENAWASNMRMTFQDDVPIETKTYFFKPYQNAKYLTFNMADTKFEKDKGGYYRATMSNMPAIKAEPNMPPQDEVSSWLLLYYVRDTKESSSDFWSHTGYAIAQVFDIKDTLKPGSTIKEAAAQITQGATTDDEKLRKIYDFCKTRIKNIEFDTSLTDEQKDDIKNNKSTADTYRKQQGTSTDINELFASLADASGYETRLAFGGDRSKKFFKPNQSHLSFIHFTSVAVKVGQSWRYFDPGSYFVPYGMLAWNEEATSVLLLGYKDYITTTTPASPAQDSSEHRIGAFKLLEDGTLEGTVKMEFTGQLSNERKIDNYRSSEQKREDDLKEEIKKRMSNAEVSDITISNVTDPEKPFSYEFKIRVPNYAQKTGKRLFLQPGFFKYGTSPAFATSTRQYPIFFHYPWSEDDLVTIQLPDGYVLDSPGSPNSMSDPDGITSLNFNLAINKQTNTLTYKRNFFIGGKGLTLFPASSYPAIKALFEGFNQADSHTLALKPAL